MLTVLNERLDDPRRLVDDGREIDAVASDLDQSTTDARDVQKVVDEPQQCLVWVSMVSSSSATAGSGLPSLNK